MLNAVFRGEQVGKALGLANIDYSGVIGIRYERPSEEGLSCSLSSIVLSIQNLVQACPIISTHFYMPNYGTPVHDSWRC
jgi:hypothetical protein